VKAVWITWENQRRNRELSAAFGMKLYEFKEVDDIKNPIEKYASGLARTIRAILSERPSLVCVGKAEPRVLPEPVARPLRLSGGCRENGRL